MTPLGASPEKVDGGIATKGVCGGLVVGWIRLVTIINYRIALPIQSTYLNPGKLIQYSIVPTLNLRCPVLSSRYSARVLPGSAVL